MNPKKLEAIKRAMIDYGAITEKYRIEISGVERNRFSDFATYEVEVKKPRARKPFIMWRINVNEVRETLLWGESNFEYL